MSAVPGYFTMVIRVLLVGLALAVVLRCAFSLLRERTVGETWCWLSLPGGARLPVSHWENLIGRAASNDIVLNYPSVSRAHAALMRQKDGTWIVTDLGSKGGTRVNGAVVEGSCGVTYGDVIEAGGVEMTLVALSEEERREQQLARPKPGKDIKNSGTLVYLTLFILLLAMQHCIAMKSSVAWAVPACFAALAVMSWAEYLLMRAMGRTGFEVETLAFFLCSIGLSVVASAAPGDIVKTTAMMLAGVIMFLMLGWILRDLTRVRLLRWPVAALAAALLAFNVVFGQRIYGSANWVQIGGISFQPSEFVKIAFVFVGAATLDRLFAKRNLIMFAAFTVVCGGALALMGDFGTAVVFFVAFLIIAFMRSGNIATVVLCIVAAALAGVIVMRFKPYIAERFLTWGHAWQHAYEGGYQQTRTMSAAASGGLLGLGAGMGWMKGIVFADMDLVFGIVCEELGLIVALAAIGSVAVMAVSTVKFSAAARSSYYTIAACAAVSMFIVQLMLNVFGSVDIIPLTGVTFPFVSKGGSSMICCWCLLAFIKAADTRRGGSFVVRVEKKSEAEKDAARREEYLREHGHPEDFEPLDYSNDPDDGIDWNDYNFDGVDWEEDDDWENFDL